MDRYLSRIGKGLGKWHGKIEAMKAGITQERAGSMCVQAPGYRG